MRGHLAAILLPLVSSTFWACGVEDAPQQADLEAAASSPAEAASCARQRFEDELGRRWVLRQRGPVKLAAALAPGEKAPWQRPRATPPRTGMLPAAELAEGMRAVTLRDGCEYVEEAPRLAQAEWAHANRSRVIDFPGSTGSLPVEGPLEASGTHNLPDGSAGLVIGADQRELRGDNTAFPMRTQILLASSSSACSATMIGESTAISAAHCFHDSSNWLPAYSWSPGVDSQDTVRFPYNPTPGAAYPSTNSSNRMISQCYVVTIPGGWISSGGDRDWDYAVIEFNNPSCPLKPGATVGWLGWGTQSDATIESNTHYVYGYPGNASGATGCGVPDGCFGPTAGGGGSCFWPKLWGWGMSGLSAWSTTLSHDIDTSGGQSGSGLYNTAQGFRKVVGVHVGCQENLFGDYNEARRIDSSVVSFIQSHSAL